MKKLNDNSSRFRHRELCVRCCEVAGEIGKVYNTQGRNGECIGAVILIARGHGRDCFEDAVIRVGRLLHSSVQTGFSCLTLSSIRSLSNRYKAFVFHIYTVNVLNVCDSTVCRNIR